MKPLLVLVVVGCLVARAEGVWNLKTSCAEKGCPPGDRCILDVLNDARDRFVCVPADALKNSPGVFSSRGDWKLSN